MLAYRKGKRRLLPDPLRSALLIVAFVSPLGLAQDIRVEELFPGVPLSKHLIFADTELYVSVDARINSRRGAYVALIYYQPYPEGSSDRYTSYALLERIGNEYKVLLDAVASDGGAFGFEEPFVYEVGGTELVVFSMCYRGCKYSFFSLDDQPVPIAVQEYDRLNEDEHFEGRGDVYRFEDGELVISRRISRTGDPSCCPSGGTLQISYVLIGNSFQISDATRTE